LTKLELIREIFSKADITQKMTGRVVGNPVKFNLAQFIDIFIDNHQNG